MNQFKFFNRSFVIHSMIFKNTILIFSCLLIYLIAFTAIACSEDEKMNPLKLEDLLKFNTFVIRVPIDITTTETGLPTTHRTENSMKAAVETQHTPKRE